MIHAAHAMHAHSLAAYREERPALSKRAAEVLEVVWAFGPLTDREIVDTLGYRDMNACRPRVTELIEAGVLVEHDSVRCPVTGKRVRRVTVRRAGEQLGLL